MAAHSRPATHEELLRVHSDRTCAPWRRRAGRTVRFDPDTQAGPRSYEAALPRPGAPSTPWTRVLDGELDRAFCLCRPPGHHAERGPRDGLLLFNNVAAAAAARAGARASRG